MNETRAVRRKAGRRAMAAYETLLLVAFIACVGAAGMGRLGRGMGAAIAGDARTASSSRVSRIAVSSQAATVPIGALKQTAGTARNAAEALSTINDTLRSLSPRAVGLHGQAFEYDVRIVRGSAATGTDDAMHLRFFPEVGGTSPGSSVSVLSDGTVIGALPSAKALEQVRSLAPDVRAYLRDRRTQRHTETAFTGGANQPNGEINVFVTRSRGKDLWPVSYDTFVRDLRPARTAGKADAASRLQAQLAKRLPAFADWIARAKPVRNHGDGPATRFETQLRRTGKRTTLQIDGYGDFGEHRYTANLTRTKRGKAKLEVTAHTAEHPKGVTRIYTGRDVSTAAKDLLAAAENAKPAQLIGTRAEVARFARTGKSRAEVLTR